MTISPEWITVILIALGMILAGFAWSISFFASKEQMSTFNEALTDLKNQFGKIQSDIETLFSNNLHYQEIIKKSAASIQNTELLFQQIDAKLPPIKKSKKRKVEAPS